MSMYAVYSRPGGSAGSAVWNLRALFASAEEAERYAAALVEPPSGTAGSPDGPGLTEAIVIDTPAQSEAAMHLPVEWIAPVVARFRHQERVAA